IEAAVAGTRARLVAEWGEDWAGDRPGGFVVLGMGKLGGGELNYSSDVDLLYVYERDGADARGRTNREFFARLAEEVTRALRGVTLGRGGIREVEFVVQAQQLVHGGKDPRLQERSTLGALVKLSASGYMGAEQAAALAGAYRFLRDVEHKLQIVHERQTHLVPRDAGEVAALARRLGFRGPDAVARFWAAHARQTAVVHEAFAALFHGPAEERRRERDPEIDALLEGLDDPPATHARLERLGF